MQLGSMPRVFAVVAVPAPIQEGARFPRAVWPAHVTLASNFTVAAAIAQVEVAVRASCVDLAPMTIRFEGMAQFGPDQDIPVQLVRSAQVESLHERLADALEALPQFAADEPLFWREGYRPHMTHVAGRDTPEGAEIVLRHVVIAEIDGANASVVGQFPLSPGVASPP